MKVKLVKKIKKNTPLEKEVDRNELKMRHAGRTDFDFTACAYEDLQDDLGKEQKEVKLMPTREELFAAMQLIKGYCKSRDECQVTAQAATKDCCPFFTQFGSTWCALQNDPPCAWPDTLFYTQSNTGKLA